MVQYTKNINIPLHMGQNVAYRTLLNSCSCNTLALSKIFSVIVGGTHAIMGREFHDSTLLHKLTGTHVTYGTHT